MLISESVKKNKLNFTSYEIRDALVYAMVESRHVEISLKNGLQFSGYITEENSDATYLVDARVEGSERHVFIAPDAIGSISFCDEAVIDTVDSEKNCLHAWEITDIDYDEDNMNYIKFKRRCKLCETIQTANGYDIGWHDIGEFGW